MSSKRTEVRNKRAEKCAAAPSTSVRDEFRDLHRISPILCTYRYHRAFGGSFLDLRGIGKWGVMHFGYKIGRIVASRQHRGPQDLEIVVIGDHARRKQPMVQIEPTPVGKSNPLNPAGPASMNLPDEDDVDLSLLCRREVPRVAMPVEVRLRYESTSMLAMIRDASIDEESGSSIGIGLYHSDVLPLGRPIHCELISATDALPAISTLTLMWTRNFGSEGCLSGGRMTAVANRRPPSVN